MFARAYNLTGGREVGEERCVCGGEGEREGGKGEGGRGEGGDCVDTHGDGCVVCGVRPLGFPPGGPSGCPPGGASGETQVHSQCWHCVGILCTCAHIFTSLVYQHMNIILPSYIMCALQCV